MGQWALRLLKFLLLGAAVCACCGARAQQSLADALAQRDRAGHAARSMLLRAEAEPALPTSVEDALHDMLQRADVAFAGEVLRIEREDGAMRVDFQVEDAVRGVSAGAVYTLREWDGLWADGARYTVGQRALVLLHAASVTGFASPIDAADGVISQTGDAASGSVDLRWIATHMAVPKSSAATPLRLNAATAATVEDGTLQHIDRALVMGLLHAWQRSETEQ